MRTDARIAISADRDPVEALDACQAVEVNVAVGNIPTTLAITHLIHLAVLPLEVDVVTIGLGWKIWQADTHRLPRHRSGLKGIKLREELIMIFLPTVYWIAMMYCKFHHLLQALHG